MQKPVKSTSEDVDIGDVLSGIGSGFNRIILSIFQKIALVKVLVLKNLKFFLIVCFVGVSCTLFYFRLFDRPAYRSEFLVKSSFLSFEIFGNFIENLNSLCEERERLALAKALNIPVDLAKSIKKIEIEEFYAERELLNAEILKQQLMNELSSLREKQKDIEPDEVHEKNMKDVLKKLNKAFQQTYKLSISVYGEPSKILEAQRAVETYLRNISYIKRRSDAGIKNHFKEKDYLNHEMQKLDSIKSAFVNKLRSSGSSVVGQESFGFVVGDRYILDPMQVYKLDDEYHDRLLSLEENILIGSDFEVLNDALEVHHRDNLGFWEALALAILFSFILGLSFLWLKQFNLFLNRLNV